MDFLYSLFDIVVSWLEPMWYGYLLDFFCLCLFAFIISFIKWIIGGMNKHV